MGIFDRFIRWGDGCNSMDCHNDDITVASLENPALKRDGFSDGSNDKAGYKRGTMTSPFSDESRFCVQYSDGRISV